jgi:hypothetical protein
MPPGAMMPPNCSSSLDTHGVFGCGGLGIAPGGGCTILQRMLGNPPMDMGDGCSNQTLGAFACPGTGMGPTNGEGSVVIKTVVAHGGVICCSDT